MATDGPLSPIACPYCARSTAVRYVRVAAQYQRVLGQRGDRTLVVSPDVCRVDGSADAHHLLCLTCKRTWPVDFPVFIPQPWSLPNRAR